MPRRHDGLLPLTHDHHHALRNARQLRLAADKDDSARQTAVEEFLRVFDTESVNHYLEEEEIVFPLVALREGAPTAGIQRVLSEHVTMHALVRELRGQAASDAVQSATMLELARVLQGHVRFEEDELFPAIEQLASSELNEVALPARNRRRSAR